MATTITLHCPSTEKTKKEFTIGPLDRHDNILQDIRSAFGISYAAVYDIRAQPIENLRDCKPDQVVQVAVAENEVMKRYSPRLCIMYSGEESADVDWMTDGVGLPWEELTDQQRCSHITCISAAGLKVDGFVQANTIRITRPYADVLKDVQAVITADPEDLFGQRDAERAIFLNWNWKWQFFLRASMKPADLKDMSLRVLGLLIVLSSFTQGSARKVQAYVVEAVNARLSGLEDGEAEDPLVKKEDGENKDPLVKEEDIIHVISTLYDKAGSLPAKIALAKENKKEKARKEAWRMRQKEDVKGKDKSKDKGPSNVINLTDDTDDVIDLTDDLEI